MKCKHFLKFGVGDSVDSRTSDYNVKCDDMQCIKIMTTKEHTNLYDAMHYEKEMMESNEIHHFIPPLKTNGKTWDGHTECFSEFTIDEYTWKI